MKAFLKRLAHGLALVLVLPCFFAYRVSSLLVGSTRAFPGWSQGLSLIPGLSGIYLRRAFYGLVLPRCGADCCLSFGVLFSHPTAIVERNVYVGPYGCLGM